MKITIIGTGYVGLVTGAGLADLGNDVICLDIDEDKIRMLKKGEIPFYEPGLKDLVMRNVKEKRLKFTTSYKKAFEESKIIFLCLPTPMKANGNANLDYIFSSIDQFANLMHDRSIIVMKSTVPVGTNRRVTRYLSEKTKNKFYVVSNPEFLKEGAAVKDFQNPDRIVIGSRNRVAIDIMIKLYKPLERINRPIIVTSPENAELIKYAANAMLATRISFMNELSQLCEIAGADIKEIAKGIGLDNRIGPRFLQAGIGYGGSCFPKDIKALAFSMEQRGIKSNIMRAVDYVNEVQKKSLVPKLKRILKNLNKKRIAIWGLSFKPRTDDIREAPSIEIIEQLLTEGANVKVYDPQAMNNIKKIFGKKIGYGKGIYETIKDANALIIATEWDEFRNPDFEKMKKIMKTPLIIDGRNIYNNKIMKEHKFKYISIGRKPLL